MAKLIQDVSIGPNLKRLRNLQGLTQVEVCSRLAVMGRPMSQSAYAMIERGTRNIFVSDLIALKLLFHVEFEEFFAGLTPVSKYEQADS